MAATADVLARAQRVLGGDDDRFGLRLEAVIRNAGLEARRVDQLDDDERDQVLAVIDRIDAGTHYPFLRTDGSFEIRRVNRPQSARRGWGTGKRAHR